MIFSKSKIHFIILTIFISSCAVSPRFAKDVISIQKPGGKILSIVVGKASYYAHDFHGKRTANGEIYNMNGLTAAHRTFPFGTILNVTNLSNKKSVRVRVTDRGPFKLERIIDLSLGAAIEIGIVEKGTGEVKVEVLEWGNNLYKKE
ncbi:MAG: septal ring lytic transglycosylase RlpA family protein [Bacteroidota bacterium]